MVMKLDCPWCDCTLTDSGYRSSGILNINRKLKQHCREEHIEREKKYQRILEIWNNKIKTEGLVEFYKQFFKHRIDDKYNGVPSRTIVNSYEPSELEGMTKQELREAITIHINKES